MELDNPLLTLEGPSLTLDDPSSIESAMQYTQSRYHAGSNSMRIRNTHYVIYFTTFYLLFLFSNSCPIILKIIPEYLVQAYHQPYGATSPTVLSYLSRWALTNIIVSIVSGFLTDSPIKFRGPGVLVHNPTLTPCNTLCNNFIQKSWGGFVFNSGPIFEMIVYMCM